VDLVNGVRTIEIALHKLNPLRSRAKSIQQLVVSGIEA